jgi:hypothetical protein
MTDSPPLRRLALSFVFMSSLLTVLHHALA